MSKTRKYQLVNSPTNNYTVGLTKIEYFAVQAMKSLINRPGFTYSAETIAESAVEYADALINELNKETDE